MDMIDTSESVIKNWSLSHEQPGVLSFNPETPNAKADFSSAIKYKPLLMGMLRAGYFEPVTLFYEGWYEMHHLPTPDCLQPNAEYHQCQSPTVCVSETLLRQTHDSGGSLIARTNGSAR